MFTVATLAEYLAMSQRSVRELLARREIPSYKIGALRRVDPADVEAYLAARRDPGER